MAELLAAGMPPAAGPYAIYGHSLGGLVAFELSRILRHRPGQAPLALFVSATPAPQLPWPHPPVRHLDDLPLVERVNERYGGTIPDVIRLDAELRDLLIPALRADLTAFETYEYRAADPLSCPISVFGGTRDAMVPRASLEAWRAQTSGGFKLREVDEDHLFVQSALPALVAHIRGDLGAAAGADGGRRERV